MSGSGALVYSTFLNAGDLDGIASTAQGVAVDGSGNAYVTGYTNRKDLILANALESTYKGSEAAFVSKVNPSGSALVYSTYLGGSGTDQANAIAADSSGNTYITGSTTSTDFPTVGAPRKPSPEAVWTRSSQRSTRRAPRWFTPRIWVARVRRPWFWNRRGWDR